MSFLLMILLTLVCLVPSWPEPTWLPGPATSAALTALTVLFAAAHAFWVSRRLTWPLARNPASRDRLIKRYERGRLVQQLTQVGLFVLALTGLGWGWTVRHLWGTRELPGTEVLTLLPFLLMQTAAWLCYYDADSACRLPAARTRIEGRWAYVGYQARQKLALVFIPVLLLVVQKEASRLVPASLKEWEAGVSVGGAALLGVVFVCMPLILRVLLGWRPLPAGPIRERLLATAKRLGFRTSDILVWNTRQGMANALVIGWVPWLRYVVFTDRMLEEFSQDEVEAVFGHEVGHIRHQHIPYYLGFMLVSVGVLGLLVDRHLWPIVRDAFSLAEGEGAATADEVMLFPAVGVMVAYVFVVFGFLSRRCERQADVFGCRAVSCDDAMCRGHDGDTVLSVGGRGLCVTGIQTFIRALDKVATVNGISRDRPGFFQSWQHSTIAKRVGFLDQVIIDRGEERRFQRRLWWVKVTLLGGLTAALIGLVAMHGWQW